MTPKRPGSDIFVSYAHEDRERVIKLVRYLEGLGWSVWWDSRLTAGSAFDEAIATELDAARCVVVVWSKASVRSDFVFDEARRAYSRKVVVPVVIDDAQVPLGFGRIQYVALANSGDYTDLERAIAATLKESPAHITPPPAPRRVVVVSGAAVLAVAAGILFPQLPSYKAAFLASRRGTAADSSLARESMVGVTLWELRPSAQTDPPHIRIFQEPPPEKTVSEAKSWTPARARLDEPLPEGSRVRVGIESSRDGLVYLIDRELLRDATTGPPHLIFPTPRTRGASHSIVRGMLMELPALGADVPYWILGRAQENYGGEVLTVIISPQPIQELENVQTPNVLPIERLQEWERSWGSGVHRVYSGPAGGLTSDAEARARNDSTHLLNTSDAAPNAIFAGPATSNTPILAEFPIKVTPRPF